MAISYIKQIFQGNSPTSSFSHTFTATNSASAGNLIVLYGRGGNGALITGVTDTQGNSWTVDLAGTGSAATVSIASSILNKALVGGTDTITVTYNASATSRTIAAYEFSGVNNSNKIGLTSSMTSGTGITTSPSINSFPYSGSLLFSAIGTNVSNSGANIFSPSSGWTAANTTLTTNFAGGAYQISTDNASKSITWTWGNSASFSSGIVAYNPAPLNLMLLGVG